MAHPGDGLNPAVPISLFGGDHMIKRIVLFLALSAALVACSSSGTTSTTGTGASAAPIDSSGASAMPSDSGLESTMPSDSASPS